MCLCVQAGKGEPHVFKEKTFKKKRQCSVCRQSVDNVGSFCRGEALSLYLHTNQVDGVTNILTVVIHAAGVLAIHAALRSVLSHSSEL